MSKQIEAMKRWLKCAKRCNAIDGMHSWADIVEEISQAIAEAEQPAQQDSPWCMKMNGCKTKCEDCPDEVPKQPAQTCSRHAEAERLADCLETHHRLASPNEEAAAELRRLVSFNQQLMDKVERLQKREWVGLTADEMLEALASVDPATKRLPIGFSRFACAIEAKLKEKNT